MIMTVSNEQTGLYCLAVGLLLIVFGLYVWKKKEPTLILGYKEKPGRNVDFYCEMMGRGTILWGIGLTILSIPLPMEDPDKFLAASCLICCLVFVGIGIWLFVRANKS